jgi:hypothetical protein
MRQGGDRGKRTSKTGATRRTGTLPKARRVDAPAGKPGRKDIKGGARKGAGRGKHAASGAKGQRTSRTRKAGPKKTPRGTTSRSGEK